MSNPFATLAKRQTDAEAFDTGRAPAGQAGADLDDEPQRRAPPGAGQGGVRAGQPQEALSELTGTVMGLKVYNDWGRAQLALIGKPDIVSITGNMVAQLNDGDGYTLTGRTKHHPKYGASFDVVSYAPHIEPDPRSLIRFIAKNYKGIGDKTARAYVDAVAKADGEPGLEKLRQQLVNEPWSVDFSLVNKSKAKFDTGEDATDRAKTLAAYVQRDLALKLRSMPSKVLETLSLALVGDLDEQGRKTPVHAAWAALTRNPYQFVRKVRGWGFGAADGLAKEVGLPMDSSDRLAALVDYAVDQQCSALGHQFLTREQIRMAVAKVDPGVNWERALEHGLSADTVVLDDENPAAGQRIYPKALYVAEKRAAEALLKLLEPAKPLWRFKRGGDAQEVAALRQEIQSTAIGLGPHFRKGLDESQITAIYNIMTARVRVHTVTAKPGSGKTAVMEVLTAMLKGKSFAFGSPTGKGAKVLNKRVARCGHSASTLHSLLQGSEDSGFTVNKEHPLDSDAFVVDEAGMPGIQLAVAALEAVNDRGHLVCLGDYRQLQSVPPGNFLRDLLNIPQIDHSELTQVHRNSGGIKEIIDQVDQGVIDCVDRPGVTFSHGLGNADDDFELVKGRYLEAVAKVGIENVALIMSRRKGEINEPGWNTTYANQVLRDTCNPHGAKIPGTRFYLEDRIIIRSNMDVHLWSDSHQTNDADDDENTVRVVNGDTGRIADIRPVPDKPGAYAMKLMLDDGRAVSFHSQDTQDLDWSYALTVHSSQGSEYKIVQVVATPGAPTFVNRTSLFTGISRATEDLQVFANDADLRKIAATPAPRRNSALVERVTAAQGEDDEAEATADTMRDSRRAA